MFGVDSYAVHFNAGCIDPSIYYSNMPYRRLQEGPGIFLISTEKSRPI